MPPWETTDSRPIARAWASVYDFPSMHEQLRHRILRAWAGMIARRPGWVIAITLATVITSVVVTVGGIPLLRIKALGFQSDRNELISEDLPWNSNFLQWTRNYSGTRDLTVVVDAVPGGGLPDQAQLERARSLVDELGPKLLRHDDIERADWGFAIEGISPRAIRMLEMPEFETHLGRILESRPVLESADPQRLIAQTVAHLQTRGAQGGLAGAAEAIAGLTDLIEALGRSLDEIDGDGSPFAELGRAGAAGRGGWQYLASRNERLLFIRVTPREERDVINSMGPAIAACRRLIDEVAGRYEGVEVGLTGIEVVEADETDAAVRDSTYASVVALVLIAVLLISAFHSWRMPLLALASLLFAIAWSFGYLTVAIGHLQIISVVFTVILLGLGIAYGIHIATRYELVRHNYTDDVQGFGRAMEDSLGTMGPGIVTGALTTAAAFTTTMFTKFKGVAEMGHIAAVGVVLCMIAMFTVFPALLRLVKLRHRHLRPMDDRLFHLFEEHWLLPFSRRPKTTLAVATAVTVLAVVGASRMRFDYDLMALLPEGEESVRWQQRVGEAGGRSIWSGICMARDLGQARQWTKALRTKRETIDPRIDGVGRLFPQDEDEKIERLRAVRRELGDALAAALAGPRPSGSGGAEEGGGLAVQLGALRRLMTWSTRGLGLTEALRASLSRLDGALVRVDAVFAGLEPDRRRQRLARLQEQYTAWRTGLAGRVKKALDGKPLTLEDLPPVMRRMYVGAGGSVVLEVYPKLPEGEGKLDSPLAPEFLPKFVRRDLQAVDPNATGVIVQVYESGHLIYESYLRAGLWALLVVFVLLLIDFHSLADALLCLVPVAMGFAATFGIMFLLGMQINPANIIVLPLMFGIGVDAGVHMLHRYRQDPVNRPLGLTAGTGKGITLTSFTTMIGFGSLMMASHRGIRSLGFILAAGIGLTMLACWFVMPACLELRARKAERQTRGADDAPPPRGQETVA